MTNEEIDEKFGGLTIAKLCSIMADVIIEPITDILDIGIYAMVGDDGKLSGCAGTNMVLHITQYSTRRVINYGYGPIFLNERFMHYASAFNSLRRQDPWAYNAYCLRSKLNLPQINLDNEEYRIIVKAEQIPISGTLEIQSIYASWKRASELLEQLN